MDQENISIRKLRETEFEVTFASPLLAGVIHTKVTSAFSDVEGWIADVRRRRNQWVVNESISVAGFGLKRRCGSDSDPDSDTDVSSGLYMGRVAVLQLCIGEECLLFNMVHRDVPDSVRQFLSDDRMVCVGFGIESDAEFLKGDYIVKVGIPVDLKTMVKGRGVTGNSLPEIASQMFDINPQSFPASFLPSEWDIPHLTQPQIMYACTEAFLCYTAGRVVQRTALLGIHNVMNDSRRFTVTLEAPRKRDCIQTFVTSSTADVDAWLVDVCRSQKACIQDCSCIAGFGLKFRADSVPNNLKPTALLQICLGNQCLLFLMAMPIPRPRGRGDDNSFTSLREFLSDHRVAFVTLGMKSNISKLCQDYNLDLNYRDLRKEANNSREGRTDMFLQDLPDLVQEIMDLKVRFPTGLGMTTWDLQVKLTLEEVVYASLEAFLSCELGQRLHVLPPYVQKKTEQQKSVPPEQKEN